VRVKFELVGGAVLSKVTLMKKHIKASAIGTEALIFLIMIKRRRWSGVQRRRI
jgi:hypothetical protein